MTVLIWPFFDVERVSSSSSSSSSPEHLCTDLAQQPIELGFWNFLYTFLIAIPRDVFWFIAIAPAVAAPPLKKRQNHVYHHSSATKGPRLLKFSVHLSHGITPGCILIYRDCANGCRPAPQKAPKTCVPIARQPTDLGFWNFLYIFLMELLREFFLFIAIAPAVAAPPPKKRLNHVYHLYSATNRAMLLKFSVHLYGITLECFCTNCDFVSGCRPAPKNSSPQPMDLGFWIFL